MIIYNKELLNSVLQRDNSSLIGEYEKLTRDIRINFICNCGTEYTKSFKCLNIYGALCRKCTNKSKHDKAKKVWRETLGVENPLHSKSIKEQICKTNREKYGTDYGVQSETVKDKIKKTLIDNYGVDHNSKRPEVIEKIQKTNMERYGAKHALMIDEFKEKARNTMFERYGVKHTLQHNEFKQKAKQTTLKRFGTEYASQSTEFKERVKQTCLRKFGVEHMLQSPEIKEKVKQTNLQRYGVEIASQNPEVMEKAQKNAKRYKEYTMPSGDIRKVQGYEPFALDCLVKIYQETDILTQRKEIPRIPYKINEKQHYYYPDIFIPSENKIIEVKSIWTYKCKADNIPHKTEATKAAGYNYEIWVYDGKGNKTVY